MYNVHVSHLLSSLSMVDCCLLARTDTPVDLCQHSCVHHLEQEQSGLGIKGMFLCGVLLLFV